MKPELKLHKLFDDTAAAAVDVFMKNNCWISAHSKSNVIVLLLSVNQLNPPVRFKPILMQYLLGLSSKYCILSMLHLDITAF